MRLFGCKVCPSRTVRRARPCLEQLEDRVVPSGTPLDLTAPGAVVSVNSQSDPTDGPVAVFQQTSTQPTGTGVIQSFLRLQANGAKATVEQGYNTDARPVQFDEKTGHNFTRSIQLSDIPVVTIIGVNYRQFLLDVNQPGSSPLISLDELQLFQADAPNLTGYTNKTLAGHTALFDLDAADNGGDQWVKIDASLNHGSGSGDVFVDIADRLFAASGPNQYVYLFSRFGDNYAARSGFEEWAVQKGLQGPAIDTLNGFVTDSFTQSGLQGVSITLTGVTTSGQMVSMTKTTDMNGFFQFTGLAAGTYTLQEQDLTLPSGYGPDTATPGTGATFDGTVPTGDTIAGIVLGAGPQNGVNFDFTAVFNPS